MVLPLLWNMAYAQGNKTAGSPLNLSWEELGPNNQGNHARALHVATDGTVWAGSVGGGLFKSTDKGLTWSRVNSLSDNLAVSCIVSNGSTIYVGTGESYFNQPDPTIILNWSVGNESTVTNAYLGYVGFPGKGVYISTDGGATFTHNNGTWTGGSTQFNDDFMSIQSMAINGGRIFVSTLKGLYYSDDPGLATLTKSTGSNSFMNNPSLDVEVGDGTTIWAATKDSVYRSLDNGASFARGLNSSIPTDAVPNNRVGGYRVDVAVAPSNKTTVYVTGVSDINGNCTGVWKSADNGNTWERKAPYEAGSFAPFGNNGRYASILKVDPGNADRFYLGGNRLYQFDEEDGLIQIASTTYVPGFTTTYVPAPMLAMAFDPNDDSTFYISGDKEIVRTTDKAESFTFKTKGFGGAHLYGVSASPNYKVLASDRYRGLLYKDNANSDPSQQQFSQIFEDQEGIGRYSVTHFNYLISQVDDGGVHRSLSDGVSFESFYGPPIKPIHPSLVITGAEDYIDRADSNSAGGGLFDKDVTAINPWVLDEYIPSGNLGNDTTIMETPVYLYLCSRKYVWVCTNPFGTLDSLPFWNRITPILLSNSISPREYYTAIAVSGDANHVVYVGTNHGRVYRLFNAHDPLNMDITTKFDTIIDQGEGINASMPNRLISDIAFDPNDPDNLVITYGAYEGSGSSRVYATSNAMDQANPVAFHSVGDLLPLIPVYTAAVHPNPNNKALIIGTEYGVYTTTDDWTNAGATINWNNESGTEIGNSPVFDLYIRPYYIVEIDQDNYKYGKDWTIFAGTHGRGMFRSSSTVDRETPVAYEMNVSLFPNPSNGPTNLEFELPLQSKVGIEIYSMEGRLVANLPAQSLNAGNYRMQLPTSDLISGMYLVKVKAENAQGEFNKTLRAVITK